MLLYILVGGDPPLVGEVGHVTAQVGLAHHEVPHSVAAEGHPFGYMVLNSQVIFHVVYLVVHLLLIKATDIAEAVLGRVFLEHMVLRPLTDRFVINVQLILKLYYGCIIYVEVDPFVSLPQLALVVELGFDANLLLIIVHLFKFFIILLVLEFGLQSDFRDVVFIVETGQPQIKWTPFDLHEPGAHLHTAVLRCKLYRIPYDVD